MNTCKVCGCLAKSQTVKEEHNDALIADESMVEALLLMRPADRLATIRQALAQADVVDADRTDDDPPECVSCGVSSALNKAGLCGECSR